MPIEHDLIPEDPRRGWVRIATFEGPAGSVERALRLALDHVVPASRQLDGWQATLGLASVDRRRGLTLSFWESSAGLGESGTSVGLFRDGASAAGVAITDIDRYEVVFHETADGTVE